jgi:hypothetical protein
MLPRRLLLCALLLLPLPSPTGVAESPQNAFRFGRNIVVVPGQIFANATCLLCSAEVDGRATGSVRVFSGNVFLNGPVAGDVLVFGGNAILTNNARVGGRLVVFGGRLHQYPAAITHATTVLPPIIFLPLLLLLCVMIAGLIFVTRRARRDAGGYPRLRRL